MPIEKVVILNDFADNHTKEMKSRTEDKKPIYTSSSSPSCRGYFWWRQGELALSAFCTQSETSA